MLGGLGSGTFPPSRLLDPTQRRDEGGSHSLTLTDLAVHSHLQLQAVVFLMGDGFGCKINPQRIKQKTFVGTSSKATCVWP